MENCCFFRVHNPNMPQSDPRYSRVRYKLARLWGKTEVCVASRSVGFCNSDEEQPGCWPVTVVLFLPPPVPLFFLSSNVGPLHPPQSNAGPTCTRKTDLFFCLFGFLASHKKRCHGLNWKTHFSWIICCHTLLRS